MKASKTASTTQSGPLWEHAPISPLINGSESAKDAIYWSRLVCVENRGISLFEISKNFTLGANCVLTLCKVLISFTITLEGRL